MQVYRRFIFAIVIVALSPTAAAPAADLMALYKLAINNDLVYQQSIARKNATLENRPQALSRLLPNLSLRANTGLNQQDISTTGMGIAGTVDFDAHSYNLNLTQPLFNRNRFLGLDQADSEILTAEAEALESEQALIIRVAERYFAILHDLDNLDFARAEKKSLSRQLIQARQRLEVGLAAITDAQEAQAGYDRAVAAEILTENALDNSHEAMREIINAYPPSLSKLSDAMPLVEPVPTNIDDWLTTALEQNMNVVAATHTLAVAHKEIELQTAGHYPTLDLIANHGLDRRGGRFGDSQVQTTQIGVELNLPLFEGGATRSRIRQAQQNYNLAVARLEQARRAAQRAAREAYLGVISGISQVKALKQALISSETALKATEVGFEVGTRTAVDVVAAERSIFSARRDHSRARYDYILNSLRLKQAAGSLHAEDLHHLRQWLVE